jgi:thioredoxin-like negative regulator of GroEL
MNEALLQNAWRLQQAGQLLDAARIYSDILRANPRNFDALFQLANIHLANKRYGDAERLYSMRQRSTRIARAVLQSWLRAADLGASGSAHRLCARARTQPDYVEARNNRGTVLWR